MWLSLALRRLCAVAQCWMCSRMSALGYVQSVARDGWAACYRFGYEVFGFSVSMVFVHSIW